MTAEFFKLVFLSIACGAISMTTAKAKVFAPARAWVKRRSEWAGEGVSCPYCTSHWVAFLLTLVYFPHPVTSGMSVVDFFVTMMLLVALASITARIIFSAYAVMAE